VNRKHEAVNEFLKVALPQFNKLAKDLAGDMTVGKEDLCKNCIQLLAEHYDEATESLVREFQALDTSSEDVEDRLNELLKKVPGVQGDAVNSVRLLAKRLATFTKFQNEVTGFGAYSDSFCSDEANSASLISDESFTVKTRKKIPVALRPRKHSDIPLPTKRSLSLEQKPVGKAVAPVPEMSMSLRNLKMLNFKSDSDTHP
jgi:hypothetical protein